MKIYSWNVNGIRAISQKGFLEWFQQTKPDVLCLQETKAGPEQISTDIKEMPGYASHWKSAQRKGYSGVAVYFRDSLPLLMEEQLELPLLESEGRVAVIHGPDFSLFNVYFPNGQKGEERLRYKLEFYQVFLGYVQQWRKHQPNIIICGDFNTAHQEIDLKNPASNSRRSGFLPIERQALDTFLNQGYVDVFRTLYPDKIQYSWWDYRTRARERNAGWRIDCFYVSSPVMDRVVDCTILEEVQGSDHCPICLELNTSPA